MNRGHPHLRTSAGPRVGTGVRALQPRLRRFHPEVGEPLCSPHASPNPPTDFRRGFLKVVVLRAHLPARPLFAAASRDTASGRSTGSTPVDRRRRSTATRRSPPAGASELKGFYRAHPPSGGPAPRSRPALARYRAAVSALGDVWQFFWPSGWPCRRPRSGLATFRGRRAGARRFWNRPAQYWSFMAGLRWLVAVTIVEDGGAGDPRRLALLLGDRLLFEHTSPSSSSSRRSSQGSPSSPSSWRSCAAPGARAAGGGSGGQGDARASGLGCGSWRAASASSRRAPSSRHRRQLLTSRSDPAPRHGEALDGPCST